MYFEFVLNNFYSIALQHRL